MSSIDTSLLNLERIRAEQQYRARRKIDRYYPDTGPLRREFYPKHMAFFRAGGKHTPMPECPAGCQGEPHRERACLGANRIGKTEGIGGYELTLHLTGLYPDWWTGRRFDRAIKAWAAGDSAKTTREILQAKLLGSYTAQGTGLIPYDTIVHRTAKQGVAEAIDTVYIRHASGGTSSLVFKSYDQKREAFVGQEVDAILLDEEPPDLGVYTECLMRTLTTGGILSLTMTPLLGLSEVVMSFLPDGIAGNNASNKFCIQIDWSQVPHLSEEAKRELELSIPPYQRDARTKGIPQLGSGAIWAVSEDEVFIPDIQIPDHWPRCYGVDVGWNRTAASFLCLDRDTDTLYMYAEYYCGEQQPAVHAAAIRARGEWIKGAIDPAARGRSQVDGRQLLQMYIDLGLNLVEADNAVESGIAELLTRMATGRFKAFQSCTNFRREFRLYRRDERGRVVKTDDHICDSLRYGHSRLHEILSTRPTKKKQEREPGNYYGGRSSGSSWMS